MKERIAVVGLGYVGLPVALGFAKRFSDTIGFDVAENRVEELKRAEDKTGEISSDELKASEITFTSNPHELSQATFFVVAVPTPINRYNKPDLRFLTTASTTIGQVMKPGAVVVYESTVYPGVTEDVCGPILEEVSGLKLGLDFTLGYSPERINPGDKEHTLERIVKIVSGQDAATLERVANTYRAIVPAGVHCTSSIKVAEAAKVIENIQRDLNISLMNEIAIIFDKIGISTAEVLEAAGTKWNFLPFKPGLVGGHCIGVDPYYLTSLAEEIGYHPQVILAGRRINDGMGTFIANKLVKLLARDGVTTKSAKVGILGLTFKENVPDLRNSLVPSIVSELRQFSVEPLIHDPVADEKEAKRMYGLDLQKLSDFKELDAIVLAVAHDYYLTYGAQLETLLKTDGIVVDVKAALKATNLPSTIKYWSL